MFDVIIIGGSFAGLSAAMALGRSLRKVLIIDSEDPCNKQTPFSHNFLTQDGTPPSEIAARAKSQVLKYNTVKLINGLVTTGVIGKDHFSVTLGSSERFQARKLLFLLQGLKICCRI